MDIAITQSSTKAKNKRRRQQQRYKKREQERENERLRVSANSNIPPPALHHPNDGSLHENARNDSGKSQLCLSDNNSCSSLHSMEASDCWESASDDSKSFSSDVEDYDTISKSVKNGVLQPNIKEMPLLVFQEMLPSFLTSPDKDNTNLNYQGGLHPIHSKYIARVHVIHPVLHQLYHVTDLHLHVHYSIAPANLTLFRLHCIETLNAEDDFMEYKADQSYIDPSFFVQLWNGGTSQFDSVSPYLSQLDLEGMYHTLYLKHKTSVTGRNNFQINGGFTCVSQRKPTEFGGHEAKPQKLKLTSKFRRHFRLMSELARCLGLDFVRVLEQEENQHVLDTFHRTITTLNYFSGCTFGVYESCDQLLLMHADINNARKEGHNVHMCASVIFLGDDNKTKRVFFAVYGRECCTQYMERDWQSNDLVGRMKLAMKKIPRWRISADPKHLRDSTCVTLLQGPANMDKHTLISYFVDCIYKLELALGSRFGFYRLIELALIVGWLSTHEDCYVVLVQKWARYGLPSGNLAIAYLKETNIVGKARRQCGLRSPFKKNVSEGDVIRSLACLASIVNGLNCSSFSTVKKMRSSYKKAISHCTQHIVGVDGSTSQHILHTLILTGALQVKPIFATFSIIRKGTLSHEKINTLYPGMKQDRWDSILVVVSQKLGIYERVAEEIIGHLCTSSSTHNRAQIPISPQQIQRFSTYREFVEIQSGTQRSASSKLQERDYSNPLVARGETQWWLLAPVSITNKFSIRSLKTVTIPLNKNCLRVISRISPKKEPSLKLSIEGSQVHNKQSASSIHGLMSTDAAKYVKYFDFLPTVWSPSRQLRRRGISILLPNVTPSIAIAGSCERKRKIPHTFFPDVNLELEDEISHDSGVSMIDATDDSSNDLDNSQLITNIIKSATAVQVVQRDFVEPNLRVIISWTDSTASPMYFISGGKGRRLIPRPALNLPLARKKNHVDRSDGRPVPPKK